MKLICKGDWVRGRRKREKSSRAMRLNNAIFFSPSPISFIKKLQKDIYHEGWLYKEGARRKSWQRKWFKIHDHFLSYFKLRSKADDRAIPSNTMSSNLLKIEKDMKIKRRIDITEIRVLLTENLDSSTLLTQVPSEYDLLLKTPSRHEIVRSCSISLRARNSWRGTVK